MTLTGVLILIGILGIAMDVYVYWEDRIWWIEKKGDYALDNTMCFAGICTWTTKT